MSKYALTGALSVVVVLFASTPSHSADAAFAGTWAVDTKSCANDQSSPDAPLILTDKSYDQHEAHCTFDSVTSESGGWKVKAMCTVEGDVQDGAFTFAVDGDKLTITDDGGARTLSRCH